MELAMRNYMRYYIKIQNVMPEMICHMKFIVKLMILWLEIGLTFPH